MAAPTPSSIQEYQTGFAPVIAPYAENLLGQAELLTDTEITPYMQYMRDRQAQFTPLQQQSFENAGLMQTAPQLGDATAMLASTCLRTWTRLLLASNQMHSGKVTSLGRHKVHKLPVRARLVVVVIYSLVTNSTLP